MSGAIFFSEKNIWSANSSVYGLITEFLVDHFKGDIYTAPVIQAIYDENINSLVLDEFIPERKQKILEALSSHLVAYGKRRLPKDFEGRQSYIDSLQEVADKASTAL